LPGSPAHPQNRDLATPVARTYFRPMALRILASLLVALSLLVAPAAMAAGAGRMAAPAVETHRGHCAGDEAPAQEKKAPVHISCASSCAAVAPSAPAPADPVPQAAPALAGLAATPLSGIMPESETPPPRKAPEDRI
jgi:hypothetical protein